MPFSGAQGTSHIQHSNWLVENDPVKNQTNGHWATFGVQGNEYVHSRVPRVEAASVVDPCAPAKDHSDAATAVRFRPVNYTTRLQVCMADEDLRRIPIRN